MCFRLFIVIADTTGLEPRFIGHLSFGNEHSTIELPADMPKEIFETLTSTSVGEKLLNLKRAEAGDVLPDRKNHTPPSYPLPRLWLEPDFPLKRLFWGFLGGV